MIWLILILCAFVITSASFFVIATVRVHPRHTADTEKNPVWREYGDRIRAASDAASAYPQEDVALRSRDGLRLMARFFPAQGQPRGCVVCMHGYRGEGLQDFGVVLPFYRGMGLDVLIPDQRAHGRSEGKYICFGVKERQDCADWVTLMDRRYGGNTPIFLDGVSMGAATVLMASALPLPASVRGIIADCGFTTPMAIMDHVRAQRFHVPSFPFMQLTSLISRLIAGFGFSDASTLDAMRVCSVPVLFVHGDQDTFVPTQMSRDNFAACRAPKKLVIIPGAGHAVSYLKDTPACEAALSEFIAPRLIPPLRDS